MSKVKAPKEPVIEQKAEDTRGPMPTSAPIKPIQKPVTKAVFFDEEYRSRMYLSLARLPKA
jgi:hypothetical protein